MAGAAVLYYGERMYKETRLKLAIALSVCFMSIELSGGYLSNSIAIFSDAAHLLTDIAGFGVSLVAAIASKQEGTKELTFGLARVEVLAALCSVLSLWLITGILLYEAGVRAQAWWEGHPPAVNGVFMFGVALFGVFVNLCLGWVFHQDHGGELHPGHSHSHEHGHCSHNISNGDNQSSSITNWSKVIVGDNLSKYEPLGMDSTHGNPLPTSIESSGTTSSDEDSDDQRDSVNSVVTCCGSGSGSSILLRGECCATAGVSALEIQYQLKQAMYCSTDVRSFITSPYPHSKRSLSRLRNSTLPSTSTQSGNDALENQPDGVTVSTLQTTIPSTLIDSKSKITANDYICTHSYGDDHNHSHSHAHIPSDEDEKVLETEHESKNVQTGGDVNLEAAYLHVLTDLIQSIGVALAGLLIYLMPHWQIVDPLCTFVFSLLALYSTFPLIKKIVRILLEGTPSHVRLRASLYCYIVPYYPHYLSLSHSRKSPQIDWERLHEKLASIDGVTNVHDLHIWSISSQATALTCHLRVSLYILQLFYYIYSLFWYNRQNIHKLR